MTDALADLPDDVRAMMEPSPPATPEMLASISDAIAKKRDEAKAARSSSGIEQVWREAEESYLGIDDANRHEFTDAKWSKPMSMDGPVTTSKKPLNPDYKSTVFVRLTARYVDAGAAKLSEILLPLNDKAFSFSETPVPDLIKAKDDTSQVVHDGMGNAPLMRAARPDEIQPATPLAPGGPATSPVPATAPAAGAVPAGAAGAPQVPLTVKDLAEENIEFARKKAKAAEDRVYDWMVQSCYQAEARKMIFDGGRIGVGVFKGPFPKASRDIAVQKSPDGGVDVQIKDTIFPACGQVDPWKFYPDPACGENIHDGNYCFEEDWLSERQVRDLKDVPGYIAAQIDKVLEEGPDKINAKDNGGGPDNAKRKDRYQVWYYYGSLKRDEMSCLSAAAGKPIKHDPNAPKDVYVIGTLINDSVIRAVINPLDSGTFPYNTFPWQRRAGSWAGIGIAEQCRTPQKMLNAATRAMLNNAGKAAGSQFVIDQSAITPADKSWTITPDKIWYKTADSPGQDVRQAFMAIEIPNTTAELKTIIDYALQLAEESTSIPLITQGQTGPTTPDTLGATQIQDNNANQLLRSIGYTYDDNVTEPLVRAYYEYLLLDPDVPNDEKGDFKINAHGSIALVERAIQDQTITQMAPMVLNAAYKMDPAKWAELFLKSKRIKPEDVQYTPEQQAKIDAQPPPAAPVVEAAKINQDTTLKVAVMKQGTAQQTIQSEQAIEAAANELEGHTAMTDATVRLHELQMRHDLALMDYAGKHQISINDAKVQLAKTAMQLNTEKELNAVNNAHDMNKHRNPQPPRARPTVQVPGRAKNGQAAAQT